LRGGVYPRRAELHTTATGDPPLWKSLRSATTSSPPRSRAMRMEGTPLCAQGLSALCCRLCEQMCLRITLRSAQAILSLAQAIALHCEGSVSSLPSAVLRCAQPIRRGSLGSTYGSAVRACSPVRTAISLLQHLCAHQRVSASYAHQWCPDGLPSVQQRFNCSVAWHNGRRNGTDHSHYRQCPQCVRRTRCHYHRPPRMCGAQSHPCSYDLPERPP